MARKMDKYSNEISDFSRLKNELSELNKAAYKIKKELDMREAVLIKAMGNSVEGTVNGETVIGIKESSRRSVTIANVQAVAPELADKLIQTKTTRKVELF